VALRITSLCVNCWACLPLCPSDAIAANGPERSHFTIDPSSCTECEGDFAHPQCASICPVEEAIVDAAGTPLNPRGSLTGIAPDRLEEARAAIQARQGSRE
jgi:Fe-S-cluster-containing hydrogenase component 2